jgi:hypothetical protein
MKVVDIAAIIANSLRDSSQDNWTNVSIYQAIYEAECVVVFHRPDATATDASLALSAGIKQSIAAITPKPNRLLDIKFNGTNAAPGLGVRKATQAEMDSSNPTWRSDTPAAVIREYIFDERDALGFYVSPPATASGASLQLLYSAIPTYYDPATVSNSTVITVGDMYQPVLIEWALYRLFGQDVEGSVNGNRSRAHLVNFANMLGIKLENDFRFGLSAKASSH